MYVCVCIYIYIYIYIFFFKYIYTFFGKLGWSWDHLGLHIEPPLPLSYLIAGVAYFYFDNSFCSQQILNLVSVSWMSRWCPWMQLMCILVYNLKNQVKLKHKHGLGHWLEFKSWNLNSCCRWVCGCKWNEFAPFLV